MSLQRSLQSHSQSSMISKADMKSEKKDAKKSAKECHHCRKPFSAFLKKRFCNNCKEVFCNACASKARPLSDTTTESPLRVCAECNEQLTSAEGDTSIKVQSGVDKLVERAERKLAKASIGQTAVKIVLADEFVELIDVMSDLVTKVDGGKLAQKLRKGVVKCLVEGGLLYKNGKLSPADLEAIKEIDRCGFEQVEALISWYKNPTPEALGAICASLKHIQDMMAAIARKLMTPKSLIRIQLIMDYFSDKGTYLRLFKDPRYQKDADKIFILVIKALGRNQEIDDKLIQRSNT